MMRIDVDSTQAAQQIDVYPGGAHQIPYGLHRRHSDLGVALIQLLGAR